MPFLCSVMLLSACGTPNDTPETTDTSVETALGTLNVPSTIDSVVILEGRRDLDIALALELPVVGYPFEEAGSLELESPLATQLEQAKLNGAEEIFSADDISLEAIAAADPDLIISRLSDVKPIQEQLETIAPVLPIGEQDTSTWQEDLRLVAQATGTEQRAEELIADYDSRIKALSTQYADILANNTFAPLSFNGESFETRPNRLLSVVLRDLGATPSQAFEAAINGDATKYSPEQVLTGFGDADGLIMLVNSPQTWQELQDNQLYQQLPAITEGHFVRSDKQTHEGGPLTALHALDVIEQLLRTFQ
ncbi:ABC transporter substrate-binding protein [Corynebacterium glutamicum]|uniref:ABC transporter substrate-binding protein n=1 Tax=Corynebacterium glutamicum TaxID=1718 RepID=UPI000B3603ED|nr:ABC transporter substrate-binding protein [Corynebacterium glutamicum]